MNKDMPDIESCREIFEKFLLEKFKDMYLLKSKDGEYYSFTARQCWETWQAAWNTCADLSPAPKAVEDGYRFFLNREYKTIGGETVKFIEVKSAGTKYETMMDETGVHRYTSRDFGRVTGTSHEIPDPRNIDLSLLRTPTPPNAALEAPKAVENVKWRTSEQEKDYSDEINTLTQPKSADDLSQPNALPYVPLKTAYNTQEHTLPTPPNNAALDVALTALNKILWLRPAGNTNNNAIIEIEKIAGNAIESICHVNKSVMPPLTLKMIIAAQGAFRKFPRPTTTKVWEDVYKAMEAVLRNTTKE